LYWLSDKTQERCPLARPAHEEPVCSFPLA